MRRTLILIVAAAAFASSAHAQEFTRSGPAGTVTRSFGDREVTVSRQLDSGASIDRTTSCGGGGRCTSVFSGTNAAGQAFSGTRGAYRGPFRGRSVTTVTRPEGNTIVRRNRWRR